MPRDPNFQTMTINLPRNLVERVRHLAFYKDLSASAIVENALLVFLAEHSEQELGDRLRALGAGLRRG